MRWVMGKVDAFGNVALEAGVASLEKLLLVVVGAADNVDSLLSSSGLRKC